MTDRGGQHRSERRGRQPVLGDVYGVQIHPDRWGACQIVDVRDGRPAVIGLDIVTTDEPDPAAVARAQPLAGRRDITMLWVDDGPLPRSWHHVATLPLAGGLDLAAPRLGDSFGSTGGVEPMLRIAYLDGLVDLERDREACRVHQDVWPLTEVEIDLGTGPVVQRHVWPKLRVDTHGPRSVLRWAELDQLPCLSTLEVAGPDRGLIAFLERSPRIESLVWTDHGRKRIDLRGTNLRFVELRIEGPADLWVNERVTDVAVTGDPAALRVHHPFDGAWLALAIDTQRAEAAGSVAGLPQLHRLSIRSSGSVDLDLLDAHPALRALGVHVGGKPVRSPASLGGLAGLRSLWLSDCWQLDAGALPRAVDAWPDLDRVTMFGFAKEDRAALRRAFDGVASVELRGGKARAQLEADADNPFRDWGDEDPKAGRVATKAWTTAARDLDAGGDPEVVLATFVERFNALAAGPRGFDIESARRDDIAGAHAELAAKAGIDPTTAESWLEERRGDW